MNHPSELLADLVDGTLDADARAGVEAHLATCPACRGDLAAASAGRDAARSLQPAAAPADLRDRILAALIVALAMTLPDIGDGSSGEVAGEAASSGGGRYGVEAAPKAAVALEVREAVNYGQQDLKQLAAGADTLSAGSMSAAEVDAPGTDDADRAASCVVRSFETRPPGRLVRLIRARFQGRDAYLAVYVEGQGAAQSPDLGVVYVTSADNCRFVTVTQARL